MDTTQGTLRRFFGAVYGKKRRAGPGLFFDATVVSLLLALAGTYSFLPH